MSRILAYTSPAAGHLFPLVPGLIEASTRAFVTPGLNVPWLLTMGNHDVVANGMLENRAYVEEWSGGERKIFSARGDLPVQLALQLATVKAGDDVSALIRDIATSGNTRTVQADERLALEPFRAAHAGVEHRPGEVEREERVVGPVDERAVVDVARLRVEADRREEARPRLVGEIAEHPLELFLRTQRGRGQLDS